MRTPVVVLVVLVLAACSPTNPPTSSEVAPTAPSASPGPSSTPEASASALASPSVAPSVAFVPCELPAWHDNLPSGRMVNVHVATEAGLDTVVFQFSPGGDNPGTPFGDISATKPPFTQGASGQPMTVLGDHFLQVRYEKMDIVDAAGTEIYHGLRDIKPGFTALREAVEYDGFEGVVGWFIGLAGPTCVSVANDRTALTITLRIAHP